MIYGWIEYLSYLRHKKSSHERREGARRAGGGVAWPQAALAAGLPDGRYFPDAGRAHHKGRVLGQGLLLVEDGLGEQGGGVGEPYAGLAAGGTGTTVHRSAGQPISLRALIRSFPLAIGPGGRAGSARGAGQAACTRLPYRPLAATSGSDARWLIPVGVITMVGVIAGVVAEGLPVGAAGEMMVGLLVAAAACWGVALSQRINDQRVVVSALVALGLCGAGLDWQQTDGPGFVVGYLALTALALRVPRRVALLAGAPIVVGIAAASAHDSANPASTIIAAVLSAGFLFVTSAVAAFSRDAHHRAEALLAREAAVRGAREQMATLAERSRLARELHDVLAHSLSGLSVQLETARLVAASTAADVQVTDHIAQAQRLAQGGLLSARSALEALRSDEIPGPGNLHDLVSQMASTWSMSITFGVEGMARPLAPEVGLTVYRAVQEALTNAAKHAGRGARASVMLTWMPDSLEVSVTDAGGDGLDAGLMSSGFGLTGMAERAAAHGGRLDFGRADGGFRVRLRLPVDPVPQQRRP
jgi:signal transduction histidine kinase